MKRNITVTAMAAGLLMVAGAVHAQNVASEVRASAAVKVETRDAGKADIAAEAAVRGNATSSAAKSEHATTTRSNATSTDSKDKNATSTDNGRGEAKSEEHRSEVAAFVKSLLSVAERDGGIGAEVRAVAKSQNDSATTTAEAMAKVENRGSLRTFLFGSDYKNLGVIRSELTTAEKDIERLKAARDKATDAAVRAELTVQIEALEDSQADLTAFVEANEDKFSVFGWWNRLFVE